MCCILGCINIDNHARGTYTQGVNHNAYDKNKTPPPPPHLPMIIAVWIILIPHSERAIIVIIIRRKNLEMWRQRVDSISIV